MTQPTPIPKPVNGVDMLSDETSLVKGTVRSAYDVDIDRTGNYSRRAGKRKLSDVPHHSMFYAVQRGICLVVSEATLYKVDPSTGAKDVLYALRSDDPVAYVEYNGNLYFTNRTTIGWLPSNSRVARPLGVPRLATVPGVAAAADGPYLPGSYGITFTLADDRGEESPPTDIQYVDLPTGGGIQLTGIQTPPGFTLRVYVTAPDGEVLYLSAKLPSSFTSYLLTEAPSGSPIDVTYYEPMPPGDFITWHNGRLFTGANGVVSYSQPFRHSLYDPAHGQIPMSGYLSLLERVVDGIYIGDSRGVWFLAGGDPSDVRLSLASTCRAVRGSAVVVPGEHLPQQQIGGSDLPLPVWLSTSGYTVGLPGGQVKELHANRVRVPSGMSGKSAFMIRNGRKQVVTPVNSNTTAGLGTAVDSTTEL